MGQEERHRLGEAVGADVEDGHEIADLRWEHHRGLAEHVEPGAERSGDGDSLEPATIARVPARPERSNPVLLADQRRPQQVMDTAIEDDTVELMTVLHPTRAT
jgi:hypothetical protein